MSVSLSPFSAENSATQATTSGSTSQNSATTTKDPTQQMLQNQMALTKAKLEQDLRKILVKIGKTEEAPKPATVLNKQFSAEKRASAVTQQAKMLGEAFGEALNEVFPGEVVGESIATFLVNIGKKKELETFKEKLTNKYPEQKELIEQLEVEELLTKYPEGKSIAVDLGWITLDLAGGAILKVFGKSLKVARYLTLDKANFSWLEKLKNLGGTITEKWTKLFGKSPITTKTQPVSKFAQKIHANLDQIIKHIMRGDVNKKGEGTGVHSLKALDGRNARLKPKTTLPSQNKYGFRERVQVQIWDENRFNRTSSEFESWKKNLKREGKDWTKENFRFGKNTKDFGWTNKKETSTMFPNGWSELKIRQAILEAAENAKKVTDPMDPKKKATRGFTKEGIPLEFRVDNSPPSVFPNFDIKSWK